MKKRLVTLAICLTLISGIAFSQIREIPKAVEETFANQYKGASDIDFKDQLVRVDVYFILDGESMIASYTNKGLWKETQKEWSFVKLPEEVKNGFEKSKYADREIEDVIILYLPGGIEQYRLKAKKNGVEKKYLYFNTKGRLLRESVTL
ncbi:MAG: PepSY-like domain-containing protein [Chitinophagaceae bacterium]